MTITCDCTYDFGPCEDHGETLVVREGASLHTADELSLLLISDLIDCGVELADSQRPVYERLSALLADSEDPSSGCAWFPSDDDAQSAHELAFEIEQQADGLWISHDDGYVITRPLEDCPLTN